jgi:hypothetical protein
MSSRPSRLIKLISMLDISLPLANAIYSTANAVLIIGSIMALAGTVAAIWSGGIRDRYADQRIAKNEADTAAANAEVSRAKEVIALANERTASLERETAEARLGQERLKAQLAWREVSELEAGILTATLALRPGSIIIRYIAGDPETLNFAGQYTRIFDRATWKVGMLAVTYADVLVTGVFVPDEGGSHTAFLRSTLTAAGISFSPNSLPPGGMAYGHADPSDAVLFVGSKPRPPTP